MCLLHPFYSPLQFLVSLSRQFIAYKVYGFIFFFFSLNIPFGGGWRRSPHSYGIVGLILCYTHRECTQMGSRSAGPSPSALGSRGELLWVGQAEASVEPRHFLSSFLIIFLHTFQEAVSALRVLNVLSMYINSLGKNLAFNLFTIPTACG